MEFTIYRWSVNFFGVNNKFNLFVTHPLCGLDYYFRLIGGPSTLWTTISVLMGDPSTLWTL